MRYIIRIRNDFVRIVLLCAVFPLYWFRATVIGALPNSKRNLPYMWRFSWLLFWAVWDGHFVEANDAT